jgi:hypothetical protein
VPGLGRSEASLSHHAWLGATARTNPHDQAMV